MFISGLKGLKFIKCWERGIMYYRPLMHLCQPMRNYTAGSKLLSVSRHPLGAIELSTCVNDPHEWPLGINGCVWEFRLANYII